jgi:hypothetical protein
MVDLRSWLRRLPKPHALRIRTRDDEERIIPVNVETKTKWQDVEGTIRAAGAMSLEALDKAGHIIRAMKLSEQEAEAGSDDEARGRYDEKLLSRDRREVAQILDAQGRRIEAAYLAGAEAASKSADKLLELVETLMVNVTSSITNMQTLATNYANVVSAVASATEPSEGGDTNNGLLQLLAGMLQARANLPPGPPVAPPAKNGAGK